jgi:drug/metabolite transporter (DMT)-like permease
VWGLADFLGGLQSRTQALLTVLLVSQVVAVVPVAIAVLVSDHTPPDGAAIAWAGTAGVVGTLGVAAFYRGLAVGTMSIVAPVAATAAVLPVLVGLIDGERPGAVQVAGMAAAFGGVILASREPADPDRAAGGGDPRVAIGLALIAAVGLGVTYVGLERATRTAGVPWSLLVSRGVQATLLTSVALIVRPRLPSSRTAWRALIALGLLDVAANACFAVASTQGLLSVVSVLSSLYPAATVVLARTLLHEKVSRTQEAGVLVILAGVIAISAG